LHTFELGGLVWKTYSILEKFFWCRLEISCREVVVCGKEGREEEEREEQWGF
jgi:hypothetical protein